MKTISYGILALLFVSVCAVSQTPSAEKTGPSGSDKERLIGAWRLVSVAGPDGRPLTTGVPTGMLIYTRDGHMSVQLMYPKLASALSNEYVLNGYEASFGSFDINESTHCNSSRSGVEYWRRPCRQEFGAHLPVPGGRSPGYPVGSAG